jgi:cell cycle checkpoint protein
MGLPRASRRKAITISSDDEEETASQELPSNPSDEEDEDEDEEPVKPQKRSSGKLKPAKKSSKAQRSTPIKSTQNGGTQKSPAKAKISKAKSKTAAKEPLPNGRTIFSFFNAATQKQGSSQPSLSPEKPSTPHEEPETIHDDSDDGDGAGVHLAKGSSTALAMRKRKVQHGESFESDFGLSGPASQKFRKVSSGERTNALSVMNEDKRPWTEQFAPKDLSELAVHKRKVADVRQWFDKAFTGRRQKVLVLKGAAGTGKTTTVKLLGQEMGFMTSEWRNPNGADFSSESSVSVAQQFQDFVGRSGRSGGLQFSNEDGQEMHVDDDTGHSEEHKQVLLIEEFPNTYSRVSSTLHSFRSALLQYLASPPVPDGMRPTPIVLVISETLLSTNTALADSFTAHRLLGPELVNHPYLDTIEFNAVAQTILTKALETTVLKEARKSGRRKTPGPQVLKHLAESGDVRSAVSSLEFLCLRGDDGDVWSSKVAFTKPKKSKHEVPLTQAEEDALKLISNRESTLGIFHAVGKVVYNKRIESSSIAHPPPWLPQHRRNKLPENDIDELIDELGTDTSTFVAALHENYVLSCSSSGAEETLDSLLGCMDSISDADLLSVDRFSFGTRAFSGSATDSLRQDEMAFQVAVRGLQFNLPYPVHRSMSTDGRKADAHKMFYPASLKLWRKREETEGVLELLTAKFQSGQLSNDPESSKSNKAGGAGVESWTDKTSLPEGDKSEMTLLSTGSAKKEMLIERLPYMAHIMNSKFTSNKLVEQITTVTRIRGLAPTAEDEDADADEEGDASQEQWTTDRPDTEAPTKRTGTKAKAKQASRSSNLTEGGGLAIPVETRVEKLVLEDDDIED